MLLTSSKIKDANELVLVGSNEDRHCWMRNYAIDLCSRCAICEERVRQSSKPEARKDTP